MAARKIAKKRHHNISPEGFRDQEWTKDGSVLLESNFVCTETTGAEEEAGEEYVAAPNATTMATPMEETDEVQSAQVPELEQTAEENTDISVKVGEDDIVPKESLLLCMQKILEKARGLHESWLENFSESESFESLAIVRVEALLKEALSLKEVLQADKKALISGLKNVTGLLTESRVI